MPEFTNRLIHEHSPYLQQHAHNPVEWWPWGPEAIAAARAAGKPILISIGYSTCHWCHVMEHETFENLDAAQAMNELYINVKIDREEHPDLDALYMQASQALTGYGGWPLNVWLTPELTPYYSGGYMPPYAQGSHPGFIRVLQILAEQYHHNPERVAGVGQQVVEALKERQSAHSPAPLTPALIEGALNGARATFDSLLGGFGRAPKFPPAMLCTLLLRHCRATGDRSALPMVTTTLDAMARGGIYDQVGGGFARYSTDAQWLVPHFEKMLYDNALLAQCYTESWQLTRNEFHRQIAMETLDYILRDMTHADGAFFSAEDADSLPHDEPGGPKEEGAFYVWTPEEFCGALGQELPSDLLGKFWDVDPRGNFEGKTILNVPVPLAEFAQQAKLDPSDFAEQIQRAKAELLTVRASRPRPHLDDKVLTSWNGLMLGALAQAGAAFGEPRYIDAARNAATFLKRHLLSPDGGLYRRWRNGEAKLDGTLEDYSWLGNGLLELYTATFETEWLFWALDCAERMVELFHDAEGGGFWLTPEGTPDLLLRMKDGFDNATPAGNSQAALLCARLWAFTGEEIWRSRAEGAVQAHLAHVQQMPTAFAYLLQAVLFLLSDPREVVVVGRLGNHALAQLIAVLREEYDPHRVAVVVEPEDTELLRRIPIARERSEIEGQPAAYVCRNFACLAPVTTPAALRSQLV